NYVCHYHLERAQSEGRFASRAEADHIRTITRFAKTTKSGDKAELVAVPEDSGAWQQATSTRDNCLGQECPYVKECFVLAARREALVADVVVVNHHLFFADVMLRDDGLGELLPACNAIIFDEAHQLPEVAGLFFGESVSTAQLIELARDSRNEALAAAKDYQPLQDAVRGVDKAARDVRLSISGENLRLPVAQVAGNTDFQRSLDTLEAALYELVKHLEAQAERSEGLENCLKRSQEMLLRLKRWRSNAGASGDNPEKHEYVRWLEVFSQTLALNMTPLHVADIFQRQMAS